MSTIQVDVVSAEGAIWSGAAQLVVAPADGGEMGITARHTPLLTKLRPGEVRVQDEAGTETVMFVSGGVMEVQPHLVTILADAGRPAGDIDESEALAAKQRAEEALEGKSGDMDAGQAQAMLAAALAELKVLDKYRKKSGR